MAANLQPRKPRGDYSGAFDPDLGLADFSRQALAHLGREYLLNGHLQDRVGLPLVAKRFGSIIRTNSCRKTAMADSWRVRAAVCNGWIIPGKP